MLVLNGFFQKITPTLLLLPYLFDQYTKATRVKGASKVELHFSLIRPDILWWPT